MTRRRFFTPQAIKKKQDWGPIYALISSNYFKVANHLRTLARTGHEQLPGHYFVFPAVTMYVAAFEAFVQEHLAYSLERATKSEDSGSEEMVELLETLKSQSRPFNDFKDWIKEIYRRYDQTGTGIDPDSPEYQNLLALKELRNSAIHYNLEFIGHVAWPARLEQALDRTKLEVVSTDWVTHFSRPDVADWAHDSVKSVVQLFCRLSGARDPFTVILERDGMPPWE